MQKEHLILHEKFTYYGANAKEWTRKCVLLLPEIERHQIWRQKGFGSIYEYAAKLAGMSRETVNEGLRILRKIEDKPALQKVVEEKGIGAVRPVATIATAQDAEFWAEKAMTMSKHTLETYVKEFKKEFGRPGTARSDLRSSNSNGNRQIDSTDAISANSEEVTMQLDPAVAEKLKKLKGLSNWNEFMKKFIAMQEAELAKQKPEAVATESRHVPAKIERYAVTRTNGICSFPGCAKPYEILHHTQRFSLEKVHDPDRLEPLCKNHERIAHLGLIENENQAAANWQIRLQPDRRAETYKIDELVAKYRMH